MEQELKSAQAGPEASSSSSTEHARVHRPKKIGNLQKAMSLNDIDYHKFKVNFFFVLTKHENTHIYHRLTLESVLWLRDSTLRRVGLIRTQERLHFCVAR